jgi:hypothetical protein
MTGTTIAAERLIRVDKGEISEEELAVLTAVLIAYAARANEPGARSRPRSAAVWQRLEREAAFNGARSWCLATAS